LNAHETLSGLDELMSETGAVLDQIEIAEEEIEAAMKRHGERPPERAADGTVIGDTGPIWQSFMLLQPTHDRMSTEFVFRAHCRELLGRVAAGEDTRPGTGPELILALGASSMLAPLNSASAGLYLKLFKSSFPDQACELFRSLDRDVEDYEHLFGQQIADAETFLRSKLRHSWRVRD